LLPEYLIALERRPDVHRGARRRPPSAEHRASTGERRVAVHTTGDIAMDASRFDSVSKLFARRRLSRRQTLRQGAAGLAAGVLATGLARKGSAQDATPAPADATGQNTQFLFVQSFQQGRIAPKEGADGTYTLTLEHGLGQTIYFSDRPERLVGASPTDEFLKGLGFSAGNPPNAALVLEAGPGDEDIAVLELFNPRYDTATKTATYDVHTLSDYERMGIGFQEQPTDLAQLHPSFGAAHLFIDDCSDYSVSCCAQWDNYNLECVSPYVGSFGPMGYCYAPGWAHCYPCEPYGHYPPLDQSLWTYWGNKCNRAFPACNGICQPIFYT
jgi:hypothetical protein